MEKSKDYNRTRFSPQTIREAVEVFSAGLPEGTRMGVIRRSVRFEDESWKFDSDEEFFAGYLKETCVSAQYERNAHPPEGPLVSIEFTYFQGHTSILVSQHSIPKIEGVFAIFERDLQASRIPGMKAPRVDLTIFIGHGRSKQWRELKDHLTDKHGYRVSAYEVGARAGHAVRDILEELLSNSSFALLVMTGEDETDDGQLRARQNVIHELGLFQGKLGFSRAIAVVEKGIELMSNIEGIEQLRFSSGNIAEIYGDVVATLRREFGQT